MLRDRSIHCYDDARRIAKRRLPWMVFDYIDGAAGSGRGEAAGRAALRAAPLQPRILNGVEHRTVATTLFSKETALPFGIAPMGMCNLTSPHADRWLAKLAAKHRIPVGVSTVASTSLEQMIDWSDGHAWFQLYVSSSTDGPGPLVTRAQAAGYETLVLTVDVPEVGRRPRELRRGFKMPFRMGPRQVFDFACHPGWSLPQLIHGKPEMGNFGGKYGAFDRTSSRAGANWDMLAKMRDDWSGNLVVKGVLSADDALKLQSIGVDAIQVSSHGGRQLDGAIAPAHALPAIRKAVGPDMPLFFDSGLRSGEDIVKAYALGADFTFLGRPFSYAIAADGTRGLDALTEVLRDETSITLAQLGLRDINDVTESALANP
ncbi:MAG: alpha-hydroxy acid oxidase [Pseudomonadota bacterium]